MQFYSFYWCLGTQSSDHHSKVMRRSLVSSLLFIWSLRWVSVIYINNSEVPRVPWNVVDAFILHLIATKDTFKMNNGHKNRRSKKRYYNRLNQWNNSDRLIIKHLRMNNVHNTVYLIDLFGSLAAAFSFLSTRIWKSHHKKAGKESWNLLCTDRYAREVQVIYVRFLSFQASWLFSAVITPVSYAHQCQPRPW